MNFLKQNWFKIAFLLILGGTSIGFFTMRNPQNQTANILEKIMESVDPNPLAKCPQDYENSDEKIAAFEKWTNDFYDKNPNASLGDFSEARKDFYIQNNCKEALQRYEDYRAGNVDPKTKEMIEELLK